MDNIVSRNRRILFYCHNAIGLGHVARTGQIAKMIRDNYTDTDVLVITGARQIYSGLISKNISTVKLPAAKLVYDSGKFYSFPQDLGIPFDELISLRTEIIRSVVKVFKPDIWVIDHNPAGFYNELLDVINDYRASDRKGKLVLGMRGIAYGKSDKLSYFKKYQECLESYYDRILVYTDPQIYKIEFLGKLSKNIHEKISYTGYISRTTKHGNIRTKINSGDRKKIIVAVGSGGVGYPIIRCAIHALEIAQDPKWEFTIIGGTYIEQKEKNEILSLLKNLPQNCRVNYVDFIEELPDLLCNGDLFIGRAGYNTLVDIISSKCPAIVIPYETDMSDQFVNAELFKRHCDLTVIRESTLCPDKLHSEIRNRLHTNSRPFTTVNIDGAKNAAKIIYNASLEHER